jgi:2-polyprenyl-6-methoxyphenol hydroxylase-like FAD-dependent oxidoreductase
MTAKRALIIGGSLGGLFAAHTLRSIGWEADVFERVPDDLASRGAGLGTHEGLFDVARRIGIPFDRSKGIPIESYICLDRAGRVLYETPMQRLMTAWAQIYRPLRDTLPDQNYHAGRQLERIEQTAGTVTAIFADGSRETGDLLIGADGLRSTVREQLLPTLKPSYVGYIAWRAMVPETDVPADVRRGVFGNYAFCLPDGEIAVSYPVPARDGNAGMRNSNIVWYRTTDTEQLRDLCTDATGRHHDIGIPPPLVRPEVIVEIRKTAQELLARPIAEIFTSCAQPFFQPIYDLASPRIAFGRVALLGDAAFVARPHIGAGVTKAGQDALFLADAIRDADGDVDAALVQYDIARREFGDWVVAGSRQLGLSILQRPERAGQWSDPAHDPRVKAVLQDYVALAIAMREWGSGRKRAS